MFANNARQRTGFGAVAVRAHIFYSAKAERPAFRTELESEEARQQDALEPISWALTVLGALATWCSVGHRTSRHPDNLGGP
jgi:hypothetical protein